MRACFLFSILLTLLFTACTKAPPHVVRNPHAPLVRKLARLESAAEMGAANDRLTQLAEDVRVEAKLVPVPANAVASLQDLQFRIELVRLDTLAAQAADCTGPGRVDLWNARSNSMTMRSVNLARLHESARDLRRVLAW